MADPISFSALAAATVMGAGFYIGGQVIHEGVKLVSEGVQFVKDEFANDRKGKNDGDSLSVNNNASDKLTSQQRQILNDIINKKN